MITKERLEELRQVAAKPCGVSFFAVAQPTFELRHQEIKELIEYIDHLENKIETLLRVDKNRK